jgi:2-polyprenyl-3-methyl-5-hydroxy-6-metoxy-1,4-benzoquinol methylase
MLEFVPLSAKCVLELGCGEGVFASTVKKRQGAEVWGLEVDSQAAALASSRLDRVILGDASETIESVPSGRFDCIVANDILEHLVSPDRILRDIRRCFSPEGVLVASIPNIRYFDTLYELLVDRDFRYRGTGILDRTHLRFFTKKSICRLFDETEYDVVRIRGINSGLATWRSEGWRSAVRAAMCVLVFGPDVQYLEFAVVGRPRVLC